MSPPDRHAEQPLRVEVTATDPVAILVATELTRIALAKLGS